HHHPPPSRNLQPLRLHHRPGRHDVHRAPLAEGLTLPCSVAGRNKCPSGKERTAPRGERTQPPANSISPVSPPWSLEFSRSCDNLALRLSLRPHQLHPCPIDRQRHSFPRPS